jgi:hypothetical protein
MAEAVPAPAFLEVPDDPQPRLIEAALRPRARPAGFDTASASRRSAGGSDPAQAVGRFGEQIVLAGPTDPNAVYRARYGPADQTMPGGYSRTLLSDPLVAGALALGTALLVDSLLGDDDDEGDAWDNISGRPQLRRVALGRGDLAAPLWLGQGPQQRQWPGDLRRRQREARQAALHEREDALHQARERAEKAERDADAARQALREQKRRIEGQENRQKSAKKAQRKPTDERKARETRTKRQARSTPDARQEDPGGDRSRQARARDPVQKAAREARKQQPEKQPKRQAQNQGRQKQPKKGQDGGKLAKADGKQKRCENGKKARCGK